MTAVSRREVLRVGLSGLGAVTLSGTVPAIVPQLALAGERVVGSPVSNDNVLVVVQLSGGNDGLNTVVPADRDAYHAARPTLGLRTGLLGLSQGVALHPAMSAFKRLFDDGQLAIVNGCGYPRPNRSHFRSMEIWHTANPSEYATAGWLGRYVDGCPYARALNVGPELPQALVAEESPVVPSAQSLDEIPSQYLLSRRKANATIDPPSLRRAAARYGANGIYPGGLGQQLKLIAQIIAAEAGTKVFYCQTTGFDTHANQLGQHERLLRNVADSLAAFTQDMAFKGFGRKVTVMCFSEFGRRVHQNSSAGTDHGAAGPMFVVGGGVKGGLFGAHPSLGDLDDGDLKYTTDFRRVYATLLDRWLNVDSSTVLKNRFEPLAFL